MVLTGGLLGLLVWVYDYDFFFNAGGPATPVSNALLKALHLQTLEYPFPVLLPLLMLVIAGTVVGAAVARFLPRSS